MKRLQNRTPISGGKIGAVRPADRIYSMESWHLPLRGLVLHWELHLTVLRRLFPFGKMLTWRQRLCQTVFISSKRGTNRARLGRHSQTVRSSDRDNADQANAESPQLEPIQLQPEAMRHKQWWAFEDQIRLHFLKSIILLNVTFSSTRMGR